jgi:tRNA(fMet)-specific endonuclease VapC
MKGYSMFQQVLSAYAALNVLSYDKDADAQFHSLVRAKVRVGTMDLRIAAIALSKGMTLLSRNLVHFRQVPGLKVEDWTA